MIPITLHNNIAEAAAVSVAVFVLALFFLGLASIARDGLFGKNRRLATRREANIAAGVATIIVLSVAAVIV